MIQLSCTQKQKKNGGDIYDRFHQEQGCCRFGIFTGYSCNHIGFSRIYVYFLEPCENPEVSFGIEQKRKAASEGGSFKK
jgi:hypothetical protein